MSTRIIGLVLLSGSLLGPLSARAAEPRLTVEVLTDVPLGIGAGTKAEFEGWLRAGVSALWVPPAYVALSDEVGQAVGGYNDVTSALVRAATENALALRLSVGARPLRSHELYVDFTYSLVALGGAFSVEDLAEAAGSGELDSGSAGWDLGSTIHQIGFEIGYRFPLRDRLSLRVAIGGSFTVASEVSVEGSTRRDAILRRRSKSSGQGI